MNKEYIKFVGIDSFNRPIFRGYGRNHFGSTDILFSYDATEKEVLEKVTEKNLTYFGSKFDCEPMGDDAGNIKIEEN